MQKEENDTLITDNKKLQKLKNILNQLGALGRSPSSSPSIFIRKIQVKEAEKQKQKNNSMMKWMFIIVTAVLLSLSLSGCAKDATAENSTATTPAETTQNEVKTDSASDDATIWAAIVMTWNPVHRTIDKEFTTEVDCWNYYENGVGEGKFGKQHLDHQNNPPTKDFNFGPDYLEYPIRTYYGKDGEGQIWLTCDIKSRYKGL